jgi:mannose-1-phosphate guanylyltransferase
MEDRSQRGPWSLVLAGGDGTRLQALTRRIAGLPIPKQYCRILGQRSLLESTLERIAGLSRPERTLVLVNRNHLRLASDQVASLPAQSLVVQPRNRDTGPGLLLALLEIERRDPRATVVAFPSDHFVDDRPAFVASVARLLRTPLVAPDRLALLGIAPDRPDPGLGYILPQRASCGRFLREATPVRGFEEKPCAARAAKIIARGALWSSFVMAFRVDRALSLLRASRPADVARLEGCLGDPAALDRAYATIEPWNFSQGFLTPHADQLVVVRADEMGWSDLGTPEAVLRTASALGISVPWRAESRACAGA